MAALYAQTKGVLTTSSSSAAPIPGLSFTLPEGNGDTAIITLNLPNPYAEGSDYPGAVLAIAVNGTRQAPVASFTYSDQVPPSTNRMPTTLVVGVPLSMNKQIVEAMWWGVRGSTVVLDTPATLSAVY
jgi:hypothetical protein